MAITLHKTMLPLLLAIPILLSSLDHPLLKTGGVTRDYVVTKLGYVAQAVTIMVLGGSPAFVRGVSVSDIVTQDFFDGFITTASQASRESCPWTQFYTRDAFLRALSYYPHFGTTGSPDDCKREIAAFFANLVHETRRLCGIKQNNGAATNKADGPIQLSWNFNYGLSGESRGLDGLNNQEILRKNAITSYMSALGFWMDNAHSVMNQQCGATINAISGAFECNGQNPNEANERVRLYQEYCGAFRVDPVHDSICL